MTNYSPKNCNIGIFSYDFYPFLGGIGRYVYNLYAFSGSKEIIVFSSRENRLSRHRHIAVPFAGVFRNIGYSLIVNAHAKKLVKKNNIGVLNIHCGPGGVFFFRRLDIPIVATSHHTYSQDIRHRPKRVMKKLYRVLEKLTYRRADKVICTNPENRELLVNEYGLKRDKIEIVPCSVDGKTFFPIPGLRKLRGSIFYSGRLDQRKGLYFMLDSFKLALSKNPDLWLYIGGSGSEERGIKKYIENNGIPNVTMLGFIPDDELNTWYNKVETTVLASQFEGFGITVIESLCAGTKVVGTRVDGIRSLIQDRKNGFLAEYGDKRALAEAMVKAIGANGFSREELHQETCRQYEARNVAKKFIEVMHSAHLRWPLDESA